MLDAMKSSEKPGDAFDIIAIYPGAIEGGSEQVIAELLPDLVDRPGVAAWAFERALEPVPMIALYLNLSTECHEDIVEHCEDVLSSDFQDKPHLAMLPLIEMPNQENLEADIPWGVTHTQSTLSSEVGEVSSYWALGQAISSIAIRIVSNIRDEGWDRKTIAPTILAELLGRLDGTETVETAAHFVMQAILADDPNAASLTRQFRMKAHQLAQSDVPILLTDKMLNNVVDGLSVEFDGLVGEVKKIEKGAEPDLGFRAFIWRRLATCIGFSPVEAAYLACLTSTSAGEI